MKVDTYVLATKWSDGDPKDPWVIGFVKAIWVDYTGLERYDIMDKDGNAMLGIGFRRVGKISKELGSFLLGQRHEIERSCTSLWRWKRLVFVPNELEES